MTKTSRRNFLNGVVKTMAVGMVSPSALASSEDWYQDIYIDRYYCLDYPNGGGIGKPGKDWIYDLVGALKWHDSCRELDLAIDKFLKYANGRNFKVTDYFNEKYLDVEDVVRFPDIEVTREWVEEFYRRHKNDDMREMQRKYLENINKARIHNGSAQLGIKEELEKFDKFEAIYGCHCNEIEKQLYEQTNKFI